jgi:hypothetical protein
MGKAHINDSKKEKLFMRREKGPRHMSGDEKRQRHKQDVPRNITPDQNSGTGPTRYKN